MATAQQSIESQQATCVCLRVSGRPAHTHRAVEMGHRESWCRDSKGAGVYGVFYSAASGAGSTDQTETRDTRGCQGEETRHTNTLPASQREKSLIPAPGQTMFVSRCCLLIALIVLSRDDPQRVAAASPSAAGLNSRSLTRRLMLSPLATATANTPELRDSLVSSYCRKRGWAGGRAGGIRRSWCAASFVLRWRPTAACSRTRTSARSGCCCSIRPSSSQRPHAQARVAWRSGWSGARPRRRGAAVSMGVGGDGNAAPLSLQPEQQVVGENQYARPEVPKWRHKAVIIPG